MVSIKTLFLFVLLFAFTNAFSQGNHNPFSSPRKTRILLDLGYNKGIGSIRIKDDVAVPNEGYVARLRLDVSHLVSPHVMVILEAGLDGYRNPNFNLFPLSVSGYYFLNPQKEVGVRSRQSWL